MLLAHDASLGLMWPRRALGRSPEGVPDNSAYGVSQRVSTVDAPLLTISPRVMVNRPRNLSTIPVVENSSRRDVLSVL